MLGRANKHQPLLLNPNLRFCCTLGTVSSSNLNYATPSFWISKEIFFLATFGVCRLLLFGTQLHAYA